ncbi:MAG: hypothetical protein IT306_26870 [Chloroflexi bacterium]|nr:hypothetical protein [Chloroflexota bacterium]
MGAARGDSATEQEHLPSLRQAVEGIRRAALALDRYHARWGAHGSIDGAVLREATATAPEPFELRRPAHPQRSAPTAASTHWSPQRRAGEPLSRSDDLYALGVAVVNLVNTTLPSTNPANAVSTEVTRHLAELWDAATAWSPSRRPTSGTELLALVERVAAAVRESSYAEGGPHASAAASSADAARRVAQARRAHRLAQTLPPHVHLRRPRDPMRVRAPLGKGHYPDMPLPTLWVAVLVTMLCSVYLLPLYFMLFPAS